jgi:mannose-6-phosphate isomerase-like protein (cupin superfamily)
MSDTLRHGMAVPAAGGRAIGNQGQWIIKLSSLESGGRVSVIDAVIPPGLMIPPHAQDNFDDVTRVIEGNMVMEIGGQIFNASEGTIVFRPRRVLHAAWNPGPGVAHISSVVWPAGIEAHLEELAKLTQAESFDLARMMEVSASHGVRYDLEHGAELAARYGMHMPS